MSKIITLAALVAPALLVTTTQVSAHAGHHSEPNMPAIIQHLLSSPYHVGLVLGVTLLAVMAWKKRTKKHVRSNTQ